MSNATKDDRFLAWVILKDLSDRAGIPEWLGQESDDAARGVAKDLAELIAFHRENTVGSPSEGSDNG